MIKLGSKRHQARILHLFQEAIQAWIPEGTNQSNHMKHQLKKKENSENSPTSAGWSISRRKFVLFAAMTLSALSKERKRDWSSVQSVCSSRLVPSLLSILSCPFFFFDGFSCLSVPSLFLFPLLSPSSPLLTFPVSNVRLPQKETQPRRSQGWQLTLTVSLFMEAENYTVTFPAFLLEISNRRGLSTQDRDPGGIETGCFCNHFPSHHFLQVD